MLNYDHETHLLSHLSLSVSRLRYINLHVFPDYTIRKMLCMSLLVCEYFRRSDDFVRHAFYLLMTRLEKDHAEVRLSAFQLTRELFVRSHCFRDLLLSDFQRFLELVLGKFLIFWSHLCSAVYNTSWLIWLITFVLSDEWWTFSRS